MSEQFKVLNEREHILLRSGMYIGSSSQKEFSGFVLGEWRTYSIVPALLKIFDEVLDNSVDEFIRTNGKFANKIDITITNNPLVGPEVKIRDNGRGIPIEKVEGEYAPVLAWTRARAGTNFNDDDNRITMGMNGVGSYCTNIFSTSFVGQTASKGQRLTLTCSDNAGNIDVSLDKHVGTSYTEVTYSPDMSRFEEDEFGQIYIDLIKDRLYNLCICNPGLTFTLNGEKIVAKNIKAVAEMYGQHYCYNSTDKYDLVFLPAKDEEFHQVSYVNGLNLKQGGSHIEVVMAELVSHLRPAIQKKLKIDVLPNQIRQHLTVLMYVRGMKNMKFNGQVKEELANSWAEVKRELGEGFGEAIKKMSKTILNTPELIDPITAAILYKKELAERLELARQAKKLKKVKVLSHIEAQSNKPEEKILFLTEGQSAIGNLINFRDPKTTGGYPLRGKLKNVYGESPLDIMKTKEIKELMSVLNLEIGKKAVNLTYGRIAILTDADVDGGQIACLLVVLFSLWPELFEQGRIFKVETPLVIATKGKEKRKFYSLAEWQAAKLVGWNVEYYKGLGTLPEEEYDDMINSPRLVRINLGDDYKGMLELAFGPDADARKVWISELQPE